MASATAAPSMIAPSTMLSGGTGSMPKATTFHAFPDGLSSTALTALEPMSRPTTAFDLPRPNTTVCPFRLSQSGKRSTTAVRARCLPKTAANNENSAWLRAGAGEGDYGPVSVLQKQADALVHTT